MFRSFPKTAKKISWWWYKGRKWFETHPTLLVRITIISLTISGLVLKLQVNDTEDELNITERQLYRVVQMVGSTNADFDKIPIPLWRKRVFDDKDRFEIVMMYMNAPYQKTFMEINGKGAIDYIGKTDIEYYGEELGMEYFLEDLEVYTTGKMFVGKGNSPINGKLMIIKWLSIENGVHYVYGMAFNEKQLEKWFYDETDG